ncbi:MAG: (d)CMP kinase [Spirochaetaceae bacterium]|nr:(d)CMP kinase [Spirochaetaceae bacterium]
MVVAIDGPAGVGKSTVAHWVADTFGFFNLNSGAFYRAMAVKVIDAGVNARDENDVITAAESAELDIIGGRLYLDGIDVEDRLRTDQVDQWSSIISTIIPVRHIVNRHLRRIAGTISLVAEGRDMTTVVFPDAEVKIYLEADPLVRARRRFQQGTSSRSLEEIENSIRERDHRDRNKKEGSLLIAADAVVLDTSTLTLAQVYEKVSGLINSYL